MAKTVKSLFFMAMFFCCSIVNADIITIPTPSMNGLYWGGFAGPGRVTNVDFQTEFASIDELRIHIIGTYTPGTGHDHNCLPQSLYGQLQAYTLGWSTVTRTLHPYQSQFDFNFRFYPFWNPQEDWSVLLDGEADISVRLDMGPMLDVIVQRPEMNITFSEIIISGTPVPEPCSFVLLGLGGLLIRRKK